MKRFIFISLFLALLAGCQHEPCFDNSGTILGFDSRKCMCCSGWFVKINQDTLRFQTLPEGSTFDLSDPEYPIEVYLDWHYPDPQCMADLIVVTRIELKK